MVRVKGNRVGGTSMSNPLWDYAVGMYQLGEVEALCLELQDRCGIDVNLLLYAAWLADKGQALSQPHLEALVQHTARWRRQVVEPLRELRREWRDYAPVQLLREQLKDLELRAEQQQLASMYAFYQQAAALPQSAASLRDNLELVVAGANADGASSSPLITRLSIHLMA